MLCITFFILILHSAKIIRIFDTCIFLYKIIPRLRICLNPNRSLGRLFNQSLFLGLFMPYQHFFMFHDVTWARQSKQAFSALEKNIAPILSRRFCVTFGILSTSLSRRSPLRLNFVDVAVARQRKLVCSVLALRNVLQRCGQSARNKYYSAINPNDRFGLKFNDSLKVTSKNCP